MTLEPLAWNEMQLGADPDLIRAELLGIIQNRMRAHPRSHQAAIGPSELGVPCTRRLGFRLAGTQRLQTSASWRPTVGTAVHEYLAATFASSPYGRWAVETRVTVGEINGVPVSGSADLYDRVTATVIDWKIVGTTTLRKTRISGPSDTYRTQLHLYGRGFRNAGLPCERVAIMYLPASGELSDAVWWTEPYAEDVALQALGRASGIAAAIAAAGAAVVIPALATADNYCHTCPYYTPGARDPEMECPGHDALTREADNA